MVGELERQWVADKLDDDDRDRYEGTRDLVVSELRRPEAKRSFLKALVDRLLEFAVQTGATVTGAVIQKLTSL